ncbi:MAG: FG-GAP repeat protein, partial [Myxococcales bacterium]|nr:FG-GAP repeat protein [Myxococcales bacterium]
FPSAGAAGGRAYLFSGATGDPLWTFDAAQDDAKLGSAVASLGDVTGDGVPDALVGARDDGSDARGRVYVISGADGLVVDPIIEADETGTDLAWFFVGELGDLDGDGLPEIYAGDFENTALGPSTGRAYVYSGATHEPLFVFTGEQAGDGLGPGRRGGDIDQDGVPDIVACSYSSSLGAMNAGQASIFSGADGARLRTITSTRVGETLGFDAVTLGDVNGDGVDDLVVSGASLDVAYIISGATQTPGETGTTTGEPGATTGDDTSAGSETDATTTTGTGASTGAGGSTTAGDTSGTTAETTAGTSASDSGGEDDGGGQGCACEVAASRLWGECALVWSVLLLLLAWRPRARRSR